MGKNILKSKTFWFNALSIIATYGGLIPIPPDIALYIVNGANIGLRVITKGPIHVIKDAATEP